MDNVTVKSIVRDYLKRNKYDGLYNGGDCGCGVDDLAPCGVCMDGCEPAYLTDEGLFLTKEVDNQ